MRIFFPGFLLLALFASAPAGAEIHPKYYQQYQEAAPEFLRIFAEKVDVEFCLIRCQTRNVKVTAKVLEVHRSNSQLKKGDKIIIEYRNFRPERGWAGPRPLDVLEQGREYPAFLSKGENGIYSPAARGASFESQIRGELPESEIK